MFSEMRNALLLMVLVMLAGCTGNTRQAPALSAPPVSDAPAKPGALQEAGDTTWRVVTSPARIFTPAKPPPRREPEQLDPPEVMLVPREPPQETMPGGR